MSVFKKIGKDTAYKIAGLVLVGALTLGMFGCGNSNKESPYAFSGKIGDATVIYDDNPRENTGILTVQRLNGDTLNFVDVKRDKNLESFTFKKLGDSETYERNEVGSSVIVAAENTFRDYLDQIKEIKVKKGLDALKGY